jgi:hypothetical protein
LAFLMGRSNTRISRLEAATRKPEATELLMLELIFGVSSRLIFPELYERVALAMVSRVAEWQRRRSTGKKVRMSAARASYKADQASGIMASIRRLIAAHEADSNYCLNQPAPSSADQGKF